jgi:hypothetical protein
MMAVGQDLLNVPFPEMVKAMGLGIAEAQYELDLTSLKIARLMAGYAPENEGEDGSASAGRPNLFHIGDGNEAGYSLLELGFTPTFYQFVDTRIEVKMSISMSTERERRGSSMDVAASASGKVGFLSASARMNVATVSASYSSKYQYSAEGSSLLRTKLVTVPAPAILEERIRAMLNNTTGGPL